MATSTEIKQRANALADKTDVNSITPKEVGGIMYDLASHGENVLRNGGTLGIRKVYESVSAMEADSTNPKDFWGDPIKKGNLVVIYDGTTTGVDNNKIYSFMKPGWELATKLDAGYAMRAETEEKLSELGSLNTEIFGLSEIVVEPTTITSSAVIKNDGTVESTSDAKYKVYEYNVVSGTKYDIFNKTEKVGSVERLSIAAYNELDELVEVIASWPTTNNIGDDDLTRYKIYVVPNNVTKIRLGNFNTKDNYVKKIASEGLKQKVYHLNTTTERLVGSQTILEGKVERNLISIEGDVKHIEPTSIISSAAIKTDGTIASITAGTAYKVFEYNVINGEVYRLFNKTSNVGSVQRLSIAAYNDLGELVEALGTWPTSNSIGDDNLIREIEYKVPSGVSVIKMGNLSGEQQVSQLLKKGLTHEIDEIQEDVKNNSLRIENLESSEREQKISKIFNPYNDLRKDSLKVLHIGNSFMNGSLTYLNDLINAADIDVSNMCLYACYRGGGSFKSWVDCWNDLDTSSYSVSKRIGGIVQNITGSSGANNGEMFRNTIKNNRWDYIIIQQASAYANDYSVWETESDGGYLVELIRLLKIYQPQATIGYNMVHSSPRDNSDLLIGFNNIANATKRLKANYGIDFIIPYGAAIQNIRLSSIATGTSKGFCKDGHHLGRGVGNYVASATYFQSLFAPRYGVSILGNTFRAEVTSEDLSDAAYPSDIVSVTDENAYQCQMAAILACCNMWEAVNPDNVSL